MSQVTEVETTAESAPSSNSPDVLNVEWLASLKEGSSFEAEGLFQGITKEPMVWTLSEIKEGKELKYTFDVTYLSVRVVQYIVTIKKSGDVKIEEVKEL